MNKIPFRTRLNIWYRKERPYTLLKAALVLAVIVVVVGMIVFVHPTINLIFGLTGAFFICIYLWGSQKND